MSQVHPLARTTPRTRSNIRSLDAQATELVEMYNISVTTARKCKTRDDALNYSHWVYNLVGTLNPPYKLKG